MLDRGSLGYFISADLCPVYPRFQTLREGVESEISSGVGRQMQLQERLRSATELRVPSDHPVRGRRGEGARRQHHPSVINQRYRHISYSVPRTAQTAS